MQQIDFFPEREKPRPRKASRTFAGFTLNPGSNLVPDDRWNKVKDDPVIGILIECDALKVTPIADPTPAKPTAKKPDAPTT